MSQRKDDRKAAKKIIKLAKEHKGWYTDSDIRYAKMIKKQTRKVKKINFLFLLSTFILFIMALRLMSGGFAAARQLGAGKFIETKKIVTRPPHPELSEVKPGAV